MVEITGSYQGDLRVEAIHGPSRERLHTDAPQDNQGRGESFSPTDLVATALGSCILTILGIIARRHNIDFTGARFRVTKEMISAPVRRIGKLETTIWLSAHLPADKRQLMERAAFTCPVHQSIHPEIEAPIRFIYE